MTQQEKYPVRVEVCAITPANAAALLNKNTHNRPLDMKRAERLSQAIQRGEWVLNGDAIRVSASGVLLDGQHRLTAILMSGKTCQSLFVTGLDDGVMHAIDTNRKARGAPDVLALLGKKNCNVLASAARQLVAYEKFGNPTLVDGAAVLSVEQIVSVVEQHPGLEDAVARSCSVRPWCKKFLTSSLTGFADYLFTKDDYEASLSFWAGVEKGVSLEEGSPILQLRERLHKSFNDKSNIKPIYRAALLFKSYRLHKAGEPGRGLLVKIEKRNGRELFRLTEQKTLPL